MTPAEKADELIRKYYSIGAIEVKQCALIAVDEILYELDHIPASNETREYWEEVKQEIEKL
jgi:hypothetical protein